ncbi:MAG: radical SAM protein [Planctomycetes bacterium]|nr:radical SAM protein [Planctomycetota bacterium]
MRPVHNNPYISLFRKDNLTIFRENDQTGALINGSTFLYKISEQFRDAILNNEWLDQGTFSGEFRILDSLGFIPTNVTERFNSSISSISLTLLHGCNMGCGYCCVGTNGSYNKPFQKMTSQVALRAVDYLLEHTTSKWLSVGFFGGEPLINWAVIKDTLRHTDKFPDKNWIFTLATNGTLITEEIAKILSEYNVMSYIPIDGPPSLHNKQRPFANGHSTYDIIVRNLDAMRKYGARFHLKAVYMENSPVQYNEMQEHLKKLAGDLSSFSIAFDQTKFHESTQHKAKYLETEVSNARDDCENIIAGKNARLKSKLNTVVANLLLGVNGHPNMCSAGWKHIQISPDGEIYTCHIAEYADKFKIGSIFNGFNDQFEPTKQKFLAPLKACKTCWAYDLCSKECNIMRTRMTELNPQYDADTVYCSSSQEIIGLAIKVALNLNSNNFHKLTAYFDDNSRELLRRTFETMEVIRSKLIHIKPCFLLPLNSNTAPIELNTLTV